MNLKLTILILFVLNSFETIKAQSIELLAGQENIFLDIQWLEQFENKQFSIFSRTRGIVDYNNESNVFTGQYINYTFENGLGISTIGILTSSEGKAESGVHYFKATKNAIFFSIASIGIKDELDLALFIIYRYKYDLNDKFKLYTSIEFYSNRIQDNFTYTVERLRLGLDYNKTQFGIGVNLNQIGNNFDSFQNNYGIFLRKEF